MCCCTTWDSAVAGSWRSSAVPNFTPRKGSPSRISTAVVPRAKNGARRITTVAARPGGALLPLRPRRAPAPEQAPQVVRVDPVAEEDEGGGQQDQGRRRGQQHHGDPGVGEGAQEVLREEQHGRERHRDREGGEELGAPGGAQGGADGGPG